MYLLGGMLLFFKNLECLFSNEKNCYLISAFESFTLIFLAFMLTAQVKLTEELHLVN
jgi:hypothetical protein